MFVLTHEDMLGFDPSDVSHLLNVDPKVKAMKQKMRSFTLESNMVGTKEVDKLMQARFIREVQYYEWLTNVIMVKKSNKKLWMCVNFTNFNKSCTKGSFLLPRINMLVDSTVGHELLSFINAFSSCNTRVRIGKYHFYYQSGDYIVTN